MNENKPMCQHGGACFARDRYYKCSVLIECPKKTCRFQKPEREVTNGKLYPYNSGRYKDYAAI